MSTYEHLCQFIEYMVISVDEYISIPICQKLQPCYFWQITSSVINMLWCLVQFFFFCLNYQHRSSTSFYFKIMALQNSLSDTENKM